MNARRPLDTAELERALRSVPAPPPDPTRAAELRARLIADIPEALPELPPAPADLRSGDARLLPFRLSGLFGSAAGTGSGWGPTVRVAAALATVALGGSLAWRMVHEATPPEQALAAREVGALSEAPPAPPRTLEDVPVGSVELAPGSAAPVVPPAAPEEPASPGPQRLEGRRDGFEGVAGVAGGVGDVEPSVSANETIVVTGEAPVLQPPSPAGVTFHGSPGGLVGTATASAAGQRDGTVAGKKAEVDDRSRAGYDATKLDEGSGAARRREAADPRLQTSRTFAVAPPQSPAPPPPPAAKPSPPAAEVPALSRRAAPPPSPRIEPVAAARGNESGRHAFAPEAPSPEPEAAAAQPSTGGSAEPNDQAYGDMFFRPTDANPFVDAEEDARSTFGLDVDTGSYSLLRSYLDRGALPPREAVRVEEVVNAFDYRDAPPADADTDFALHAEGAPSPFALPAAGGTADPSRYQLLRFALRARDLRPTDRRPAVLTFVIDVSGSMAQENRLALVKQSLHLLVDQLRGVDRVGLVVYGSDARVVLPHAADLDRLRAAIDGLRPEGATNAEAGLRLGYDLAGAAYREGAVNRVILCSDGVANVGRTGPESILGRIGSEARRGIELTSVGFGMGNYNDALMEQLADQGNGRYAYIDDLGEARRLFVEKLAGTLVSLAGDAKAQVVFDPNVVERWRLLGYENRDIADERFRDDTVDAGEIGYGHTVTALYEVKLRDGVRTTAGWFSRPVGQLATLHLRYRQLATGRVVEVSRPLGVAALAERFDAASPALRLAASAAEWAELLRGSYWAKGSSFAAVARELARLPEPWRRDPRVEELTGLVAVADRLASPARGGRGDASE